MIGHDHSAHGHGHHHHGADPVSALGWAFALNAVFLVVEVVVGLWSGSIAILSDAGHMVSDVGALLLALIVQRISRLAGSKEYTFGLRRLPVLAGWVNALTLYVIVIAIVFAAVGRMAEPVPIASGPVLWIGALGLIVNLAGAYILYVRGGGGINTRGALVHLLADALGSVGVLISGIVLYFTGWWQVDPIVSILLAGLIALGAWPVLRDAVRSLLNRSPPHIDIDDVRKVFLTDGEVRCLEDLHLFELDSDYIVLSARIHSDVSTLDEADRIVGRIESRLKSDFGIRHVTISVGQHRDRHDENDCLQVAS